MTEESSIKECPLLVIYSSSRILLQIYDELLSDFDLTYTQYLALVCISEHQICTISDIGERLSLDSGTLSPLIKKLETKGLVKRKRSLQDERRLNVCMTKTGSELLEKTTHVRNSVLHELPLNSQDIFFLKQILRNLQIYRRDKLKIKRPNKPER